MADTIFEYVLILGMFNFYLEVIVIQTLLMYKQKRRSFFLLRLLGSTALAVGFVWLPFINIGEVTVSFLIVIAYLFGVALFCYKTSVVDALFYTVAGFGSQHIAYQVLLLITEIDGVGAVLSRVGAVFLYLGVNAAVYALLFFVFARRAERDISKKVHGAALIGSVLIIFLTFILSPITPTDGWLLPYRLYAIICCSCALCIQYVAIKNGALDEKNAELELEKTVLRELIRNEQKQHEYSRDTIDYINMKCHDLKQQVLVLREMDKAKRNKSIDEIEREIMIYDKFAKTGNAALDIVLTEKGLLCDKYNIRFMCIADGESVSFMDETDISVLFGNILSNAIESVTKCDDEDKRFIKLYISVDKGLVHIHSENFCLEQPQFENGLPVTTKADKREHGFGGKSIRYVADKYGGGVVMSGEGNIFLLDITIPRPIGNAAQEAANEAI